MTWLGARRTLGVGLVTCVALLWSLHRDDGGKTHVPTHPTSTLDVVVPFDADVILVTAAHQDAIDLQLFLAELEQELELKSSSVHRAIEEAVDEATDMTSCARLVGYLAYDLLASNTTAEAYLRNETREAIDPILDNVAAVGTAASDRLGRRLDTTNAQVAYEFCCKAQIEEDEDAPNEPSSDRVRTNFNSMLRSYGIGAAVLTPAAILDGVLVRSILRRHLATRAAESAARTAARVLAAPVARTATSVVGAAADGPLPIGDVVALACSAWTIYDVVSLRVELRDQLRGDLRRAADQARHEILQRALTEARATLGDHARARQDLARQLGFALDARP